MKRAPVYPSRLPQRCTANHLEKLRAKFRPGTRWISMALGRIEVRRVNRRGELRLVTLPERRTLVYVWPFYLAHGRLTKPA